MRAAPPAGQTDRLQELHDFAILDTGAEAEFDDVVQLASRVCGMPISLISLVDAERQWFKASVGMDDRETPIEQAICAHTILEEDFLEIPDTQVDPRTYDNLLVTGPENLRFYAGAVLRSSRGHALGTLCVLDNKPGQLTDLQRDTLRVLARQVMTQLELRRALDEAEILRREVDHRVKNSLQSVSALTRMQARTAKTDETREALEQTRRRIETVALLHQHLYSAKDGSRIDMADVLPRVASLLQQAAPPEIHIRASADPILLAPPQAAAIGVIVNEFATNSMKHAFGDRPHGDIAFALTAEGSDHARLICRDNGTGLSDTTAHSPGLGLRIIEASAQQLGYPAGIDSGPDGTSVTIRINLSDAA